MILVKELLVLAIVYYWLVCVCVGEPIKAKQCRRGRDFVKSEIHEIGIEPCPTGGVCEFTKGTNASIKVRFTPLEAPSSASACKLKSKLVWVSKIDMNFGNISSNACDYMKCPLVANEENVFEATFFVSKMWPTGIYPLKLRVQQKNGKRVFLCQVFKIMITGQQAEIVLN